MEGVPVMEHVTSADGTRIGYRKAGTGPPLLLVHGTTADHTRWSAVAPRLEERFTVYAMDRRGRGASADGAGYDLAREAEDVAAVVASIGEPVHVLAHSFGAVVALEGALLTDGVGRLILYEPPLPTGAAFYPPDVPGRMEALIARGEHEAALEVFFREVVRMPPDDLAAFRRFPMWERRIALVPTVPRELVLDRTYRFDPERFAGFGVPTLLLVGGESPPVFRQAVEALAAALPGASVVTLAGQKHAAMDTDPEGFLGAVLGFLDE